MELQMYDKLLPLAIKIMLRIRKIINGPQFAMAQNLLLDNCNMPFEHENKNI